MYLKRFADAAEAFDVALALRPRDLETQLALGTARAEGGQFELALAAYQLATETHGEDSTAWYLRGKAAADLGRLDEARAAFAKALELDPELELAREALDALPG
jgi:Flp pilus assembly protein TadD